MGKDSRVEYGTVEFEMGGKDYVLKPSVRALHLVLKKWGNGMEGALPAMGDPLLAIPSTAFLIAVGTGKTDREQMEEIEEAVFAEGVGNVQQYAMRFLTLLMNPTGKKSEEEEESGE